MGLCLVPFILFLDGLINQAGNTPNVESYWCPGKTVYPCLSVNGTSPGARLRSLIFCSKSMALLERRPITEIALEDNGKLSDKPQGSCGKPERAIGLGLAE